MEPDLRYCQSCGMPLDINKKQFLGTNTDNTCNSEFCFSCYKDGLFTADDSMEHLIELWIENTDWYNEYANTSYTPDEFRIILKKRLPTLKRWRQKYQTKDIHHTLINRIVIYINQHLFEDIEIDYLSKIAGISKYHFLRTFKSLIGENAGTYIQRLRLEYIAHLLLTTDMSLSRVAQQVNYQSKYSLSKAFRKHFGVSPFVYKENNNQSVEVNPTKELICKIKQLSDLEIISFPLDNKCNNCDYYTQKWKELICYSQEQGLKNNKSKFISISLDDSLITGTEKSRFILGIIASEPVKPNNRFQSMQIPSGKYAVFQFKGDYSKLYNLYRDIHLIWLPQSGFRKKSTLSFEVYINTPLDTSLTDLMTEVYIPIEKRH